LDQDIFNEKNEESLRLLMKELPSGIAAAVGHVSRNLKDKGKNYFNNVSIIKNSEIIFSQAKTLLPSYDVFDESRYFESSSSREVIEISGVKTGIAICEDLWHNSPEGLREGYGDDPVKELLDKGAQLIISPAASPFFAGKRKTRFDIIKKISRKGSVPVVYVNSVGGNDSLIFDGNSMVFDSSGTLVLSGKGFEEDLFIYDTGKKYEKIDFEENCYSDIEKALVMGLRDYLRKCGFEKVHLGLSGGIDSALVAVLAVKATGRENVKVFAMPSEFSSEGSLTDAEELAVNLGLKLETIPIKTIYDQYITQLDPFFRGTSFDLAEENLQARIRGTLMMGYSNKWKSLLLTTGNKSELSTGYCTLYGDMAGGIGIIGDLFKTEVFALCRFINKTYGNIIPESTISKPPSAELRPDQKDEDSLPPYPLLDEILKLYIVENRSRDEIVKTGFDDTVVGMVISLVARAEHKRVQAPPVLKISPRAFGIGRRVPLARKLHEN
ncbi:MAG: NAD+ synthase, partial [Spirochaetia bacterium]|nr:NAD+ synthase [Spirochaetia bacterium]